MEDDGDNGRISVSRDKLRADLGDLRDELKEIFRKELQSKADVREVRELAESIKHVVDWRMTATAGEFTPAQLLTLDDVIERKYTSEKKEAWTARSRRNAGIGLVLAVGSFISGIAITLDTVFKYHHG